MRAFVSDATGLLGRRVVDKLLADRHDVTGVGDTASDGALDEVSIRAWPKRNGAFGKSLDNVDWVFVTDLGGAPGTATIADRAEGLIKAAAKAGVKRIVLISSAQIYDPVKMGRATVSESGPFVSPDEANPLAQYAFQLENALRDITGQVERVALRVPVILATDSEGALDIVRGIMASGKSGDRPSRLHPIDADELAHLTVVAARAPKAAGHAINLAAPASIATEDAVAEVTRLAGVLKDDTTSEVRVRPEYGYSSPVLSTQRAEQLLPKRTHKSAWINLAELVQELVRRQRIAGELPAITYKTSPAKMAVERREKPLKGKVAVVTGATDGIGRATALMLSRLGAKVVATGRNKEAGAALLAEMKGRKIYTPGKFIAADLTSQDELRKLAAKITKAHPAIDILINNAGAAYGKRNVDAKGIETTFALNVLAPFMLSQLLADALKAAKSARIVNLSSEAHQEAELNLDDLMSETDYEPVAVFGRSKLASLMLTNCLAGQLKGSTISAHAVHPGDVRTNFGEKNGLKDDEPKDLGPQAQQRLNTQRDRERMQKISPEEAAAYVVNLAMSPEHNGVNGLYLNKGTPETASEMAKNADIAWDLWDRCADMAGLTDQSRPS